jgi:hypothetical protein
VNVEIVSPDMSIVASNEWYKKSTWNIRKK